MDRMRLTILAAGAAVALAFVVFRPRRGNAAMPQEGAPAPNFQGMMVYEGYTRPIKLSDYKGSKLVLYFYPKDNTPGCTKEACAFRDGFKKFKAAGVYILGCSVDSAPSHAAFIKKYNLPFPLLLDPDKKIATAYGAANGIPILGLNRRITFVIDEHGKIVKVYPRVDPSTNPGEILSAYGATPLATSSPLATPAPTATPAKHRHHVEQEEEPDQ
ncbi:MAG TPA: peroxiredoxin [Candidatus Binataceae bacterium]|nr:peroxiredoxin [Candidatus Binataceae bacterium]